MDYDVSCNLKICFALICTCWVWCIELHSITCCVMAYLLWCTHPILIALYCELTYDFHTCLLIPFYTHRHTHSAVSTPQHRKEQWCLLPLSNHHRLLQTHTHRVISLGCVCVCLLACSDNVSVCVLLTLSIVSSLIISPPPRHGHQLLRGAIIWNWFSPPHAEPGSKYKMLLWQDRRMKANDKGLSASEAL